MKNPPRFHIVKNQKLLLSATDTLMCLTFLMSVQWLKTWIWSEWWVLLLVSVWFQCGWDSMPANTKIIFQSKRSDRCWTYGIQLQVSTLSRKLSSEPRNVQRGMSNNMLLYHMIYMQQYIQCKFRPQKSPNSIMSLWCLEHITLIWLFSSPIERSSQILGNPTSLQQQKFLPQVCWMDFFWANILTVVNGSTQY